MLFPQVFLGTRFLFRLYSICFWEFGRCSMRTVVAISEEQRIFQSSSFVIKVRCNIGFQGFLWSIYNIILNQIDCGRLKNFFPCFNSLIPSFSSSEMWTRISKIHQKLPLTRKFRIRCKNLFRGTIKLNSSKTKSSNCRPLRLKSGPPCLNQLFVTV